MATTQQENKKRFTRKKRKFQKREKPEFEQKLLDLARVTRVVKGGRRFSFRASVVIGNKKGKVGFGVAKGSDVSIAIGKAFAAAQKNVITVKITGSTIAFDITKKLGAAKVLLRPAKEGRGIVAGGAMRSVIELAGIKDVVAKSLGTSNKLNVARVTMAALEELSLQMVGAPTPKKTPAVEETTRVEKKAEPKKVEAKKETPAKAETVKKTTEAKVAKKESK